jgi:glycosyltransferase involved in cell wall biosynthesis
MNKVLSVDIIIPTYKLKSNSIVVQNLESNLSSFQNLEVVKRIILVSDWPDDNEFLSAKSSKFSKVFFVDSKINSGQAYARNLGFTFSSSEYLIFLDQDDVLNIGDVNWSSDVVFFKTILLSAGNYMPYFKKIIPFILNKTNSLRSLLPFMLSNIRVSPGSLSIKRNLFIKINGFPDLKSKGSDDYGLLIRAMRNLATVEYSNDSTFIYKIHGDQSRNELDLVKSIREFYLLDKNQMSFWEKRIIALRVSRIGILVEKMLAKIISL